MSFTCSSSLEGHLNGSFYTMHTDCPTLFDHLGKVFLQQSLNREVLPSCLRKPFTLVHASCNAVERIFPQNSYMYEIPVKW